MTTPTPTAAAGPALHSAVPDWYSQHGRDLPRRDPDCTPRGVYLSEVMSQQTPVARVQPVWERWLQRWPTPAALAADSPGEAVRMWDRLGYPRRALRLWESARVMVEQHDGQVPRDHEDLLALPGVGAYTAAAVASFAYEDPRTVVDTNVRRVLARTVTGTQHAAPALTAAEMRPAQASMPADRDDANAWNAASMELGALICTARSPKCLECPVVHLCAWQLAGRPEHEGPARRGQARHGTDRQVRGRIVQLLRESPDPVSRGAPGTARPDDESKLERCLAALVDDGSVEPRGGDRYSLPS
ncbi:A/G-specific adenine glycosylase [Janibacter limosus]|uniref:A/G-specific adenine glycosylase n=1 Tax=Janibacter limosus TaxID=53458 RepID=UPI0035DC8EDE|nr:A/G-specific adenine glycosylase [Janibacter limosus]